MGWLSMAGRLLIFVIVLAPGWYNMLAYFLGDPFVVRDVPYSDKITTSRNYLDIYMPPHSRQEHTNGKKRLPSNSETSDKDKIKKPVVIFVSGGAWIIGYKLWSALVGRALSMLGTVVICPDYRNFPQGCVQDMMEDVSVAVKWAINNIEQYGGDPHHIVLAGQSAGAHISMMLLLDAFEGNTSDSQAAPLLSESDMHRIKLMVGVSGPYNLHVLDKHLHLRGLDTSILHWICNDNVDRYSPTLRLKSIQHKLNARFAKDGERLCPFPPVALYHGSDDMTVPSRISEELAQELATCGIDISLNIYENLSHTDLILEGPLVGNNQLLRDIVGLMRNKQRQRVSPAGKKSLETVMSTAEAPHDIDTPLAPRWLVKIAKTMNPF